MNDENGQIATCCPICGAPFSAEDDFGDVFKCSRCGNEVIRKVSFEDRISMVAFNKVLREGKLTLSTWLMFFLAIAHVNWVSFRWAMATTGILSWIAWGCAIYCAAAFVLLVFAFFTRKVRDPEVKERKIFEQCAWSIEKFRALAKDPKSKIDWLLRRSVEEEYQTVKKWMS